MSRHSLKTQAAKALGSLGGKATQAARTPEERRAFSQRASAKRWAAYRAAHPAPARVRRIEFPDTADVRYAIDDGGPVLVARYESQTDADAACAARANGGAA